VPSFKATSAPKGFTVNAYTGQFEKIQPVTTEPTITPEYKATDIVTLSHPTSGSMQSTYKDYEDWWKTPGGGSWKIAK
jgi:hypothetical protein